MAKRAKHIKHRINLTRHFSLSAVVTKTFKSILVCCCKDKGSIRLGPVPMLYRTVEDNAKREGDSYEMDELGCSITLGDCTLRHI